MARPKFTTIIAKVEKITNLTMEDIVERGREIGDSIRGDRAIGKW